jgi:hypothetical protein
MIAIRTTDDWTTATIDWTDGVTPLTWTPSASVHDARAAADDLAAWLLAQYGVIMTWTWDRLTPGTPRVEIILNSSLGYIASAAAIALLGPDPTSSVDTSNIDFYTPRSVIVPLRSGVVYEGLPAGGAAYIGNWEQSRPGMMPGTAQGAISAQPPGTSSYRPIIKWTANDYEVAVLRNSLAVASNPRTAAIYDVDAAVWRDVSFGAVTIRSAPARHSVSVEALG